MSTVRVPRRPLLHVLTVALLASGLWLAPEVRAGSVGYHHLGAVSDGRWSGVKGRLQVTDPEVRSGTYDFVAARFMVKQSLDDGGTAWLEAGWSENGWRDDGAQVIYTYDSVNGEWRFHEAYRIRPGDRVWLYLKSTPDGEWGAWLWWRGGWRQLVEVRLPGGREAQVEEFVEVYVDPDRGGEFAVPPVSVDNVSLRSPVGLLAPWRDEVATATGDSTGPYCLAWARRYDTWTAGDC
ncbi:MAG: hypothetical protein ACRDUA_08425 [Micromonosporaceae bacterium]